MFNKELAKKIDNFIKEKFPMIYEFNFDGIVLTWGGSIRNTMMGLPVKDLDFVILTQGKCQIKDFIKKYKLDFCMNGGGGYKIFYDGFLIDIRSTDDLLDAAVYDADMIFYDININQFINCGAIRAFENGKITQINFMQIPIKKDKFRYKKIVKFIKYTFESKKVKVKHNKFLWHRKMFIKTIFDNVNKIFKGSYSKCVRFISRCKLECMLWVILKVFLVIISSIIPFVFGKVLINIFNKNNEFLILLAFFLLNILSLIFIYIISKLDLRINKKMEYCINSNIANCVLNFMCVNVNGKSFINLLKEDPKKIVHNCKLISELLIENISFILILLIVFFLNYKLGIILMTFVFLGFNVKNKYIKLKRNNRSKNIYDYNNCTGTYGNMVYNLVNIVKENNTYEKENNNNIVKLIQYICFVVILYVGFILINKNLLSVSSFIIISIYSLLPFKYIINFGQIMNLVTELNIYCYRLFNLIDGNLYINKIFGNKYNARCTGNIEFENVKFKYNYNDKYILNNCSFKIGANNVIGFLNENNEEKNAILDLISRLYNADDGFVKIDNIDITEYSESYIRENIAMISQRPYLFDMSIKDNLRLIKENITDKDIINICKLVYLDDYIKTLPNKYDTIIDENNIKFDGFFKQRLGIARAILKNTKIIMLHDCNYENDEYYVIMSKIIKNIKKKRTIIVASNDDVFSSVCDKIY